MYVYCYVNTGASHSHHYNSYNVYTLLSSLLPSLIRNITWSCVNMIMLVYLLTFIRVDEGKKIHEHDHIDAAPSNIPDKAGKQAGKQRIDIIGIIMMTVRRASIHIAINIHGAILTKTIDLSV